MPFRLRHLQHNLELNQGEFLIGRSPECQLALDDPLVSRKHAALRVTADSVTVEDLNSRNGVIVNGVKIEGPRELATGDRIVIGSQEMMLIAWSASQDPAAARRRVGTQTLSFVPGTAREKVSAESAKEPTKKAESLSLLASLADKAFALGRADDAERILATVLQEILRAVQNGKPVAPETADLAGNYAVRLAGVTGKGSWIDYTVSLYAQLRKPCPASIVDELHNVVRKVQSFDRAALRAYAEILLEESEHYGPAERFLVQRIEGLERLVALR